MAKKLGVLRKRGPEWWACNYCPSYFSSKEKAQAHEMKHLREAKKKRHPVKWPKEW